MLEHDPINWSAIIVAVVTSSSYAFRSWLGYRERQALRAQGQNVPVPPEGPAPTLLLLCGCVGGLMLADPAAHGMARLLPPRRPVELCRPACARNEKCVGRVCTLEARPPPPAEQGTMTSAVPPEPPPPPPPRRQIGPQSALELSAMRWTDGISPFDRYEQ